jgi:hypothetical protein
MRDAVSRDHFTGAGESTKACGNVERRSAKAAVDADGLARVDADADVKGYGRMSAIRKVRTSASLPIRSSPPSSEPSDR